MKGLKKYPCCAGCYTPTQLYRPGGICPGCELADDLLDVISRRLGPTIPDRLLGEVRARAWAMVRQVWEQALGPH